MALNRTVALRYLRYGPPYYRMHLGPGTYEWSFADQVCAEMRRLGIPGSRGFVLAGANACEPH